MQRFGGGWQSTVHVRFIHSLVRRNLAANPKWKAEEWGLPLCQIDMVATIYAFGVVFLFGLRALGVIPTLQESKDVMHLWKYTGWLMGVDERWLSDSESQGALILYHTLITQSPPNWTSQALGKALSLAPLNVVSANVPRLFPKLRGLLEKRGRKEQQAFMATFGEHGHKVIQPDKSHPAHVA